MNAFVVAAGAVAAGAGVWYLQPRIGQVLSHVGRAILIGAVPAGAVAYWVYTLPEAVRWLLLVTTFVVAVVVGWALLNRSSTVVARRGRKLRRNNGMATSRDIFKAASSYAVRRKGSQVRPSIGFRDRYFRAPATEFGMRVLRVGAQWVHVSFEDVLLVVGGPRKGKTALGGGLILDAPGSVITTSTRLDALKTTRPHREAKGRKVEIYNPGGLGGLPSTVTFDPVHGCQDSTEAIRRAADMIPPNGGGDRGHWDGLARDVLAVLMHAAALKGGSMLDVQAWAADPDRADSEVRTALSRSDSCEALEESFNQFVTQAGETRSSITTTMRPALAWLAFTPAWESTQGNPLDVEDMIRSGRVDLHTLGRKEAGTAPLVAAFVGHVARVARNIAADKGGRLDPPLSMILDEAARSAPVPLPDWCGDAGGSGIQVTVFLQSLADLSALYGSDGAEQVLDQSGSIYVFGGTASAGGLDRWTKLVGEREEPVVSYKPNGEVGSTTTRLVPTISPAQLRAMPEFRAVLFANGLSPVIGRTPRTWRRMDVRMAKWQPRVAKAHGNVKGRVKGMAGRLRKPTPVTPMAELMPADTVVSVDTNGEATPVAATTS